MFNRNLQVDIDNLILSRKNELDSYIQTLIDDYGVSYQKRNNNSFIYVIDDKFDIDDNFIKQFTTAHRKLTDIGVELLVAFTAEYPNAELSSLLTSDKLQEIFIRYQESKYNLEGIRRARFYLRDIKV